MKLLSWNVNGIRAAQGKGFIDWVKSSGADVIAIQETKAHPDQLDDELKNIDGYHSYFASAVKKGYSGVAIYSKTEPLNVTVGLGIEEFDNEGRTLIAEYDDVYVISTYVPSASKGADFIPFKLRYGDALLKTSDELRKTGKGVVIGGDINISHQEIDLARPKQNANKTTGFYDEERDWITKVLNNGYIDIFRELNPELEGAYSWWSYRGGARGKNVGWRLDYFFISADLRDRVETAEINSDVMGSDHCPISLVLK